jgi:Fur family peroxide stress response transcriptional regulator
VPSTSPSPDTPRRRNRSRQRDELLGWLQSTDSHPSAGQIRDALSMNGPAVSLATVYRNLEVLLAEGVVREVACQSGPARYDANLAPHQHFTCESCGRITDVDVPAPRGLAGSLEGQHGLRATRVSITFYGLCQTCQVAQPEGSEASPSHPVAPHCAPNGRS